MGTRKQQKRQEELWIATAKLARLDWKQKKKGSNKEWQHPHDPGTPITSRKDGRTHRAHKAEHAVDLETGAVVGVTVQGADRGDTTTIQETFIEAAKQVEAAGKEATTGDEPDQAQGLEEVVTNKDYHSGAMLEDWREIGVRSYISELQRERRNWNGKRGQQAAVYGNQRRIRSEASHSCTGGENYWRETSPISTTRAECGGPICGDIAIF